MRYRIEKIDANDPTNQKAEAVKEFTTTKELFAELEDTTVTQWAWGKGSRISKQVFGRWQTIFHSKDFFAAYQNDRMPTLKQVIDTAKSRDSRSS